MESKTSSFIGIQSIFDCACNVIGYEMLYRESMKNFFPIGVSNKHATRHVIDTCINNCPHVLNEKLCFINFDHESLMNDLKDLDSDRGYIIEVLESCQPNKELLETFKDLYLKGYTLALDDFDFDRKWLPFLSYVSIIKVCLNEVDILNYKTQLSIQSIKEMGIKLLAEKIETEEDFKLCQDLGFNYYQGYFLAKPEVISA